MAQAWMITAPRSTEPDEWGITHPTSKREIRMILDRFDVKHFTIGIEVGKKGYQHYQMRMTVSGDPEEFFDQIKDLEPTWHLEKAEIEKSEYERKEGRFWSSDDTPEIRMQRFGKLTIGQEIVMGVLQKNNDRQITVWVTIRGGYGKSWLAGHLWETGQAHICQSQDTVKGMIQDIASDYMTHGWRPYVVIDIPRTWHWTDDLCCAVERIKDGLIKDPRYGSKTINIRGIRILILTNQTPKLHKLSEDRWVIIDTRRRPHGTALS